MGLLLTRMLCVGAYSHQSLLSPLSRSLRRPRAVLRCRRRSSRRLGSSRSPPRTLGKQSTSVCREGRTFSFCLIEAGSGGGEEERGWLAAGRRFLMAILL